MTRRADVIASVTRRSEELQAARDLQLTILDTVTEAVETATAPVAPGTTYTSATLTSPTTLVTGGQWYDGPTLTLGEGTWLITAHVTIEGEGSGSSPSPGGAAVPEEFEVDFGTVPVAGMSWDLASATITSTAARLRVYPDGRAPTGDHADANEWDCIQWSARATSAGNFRLHAAVGNGTTSGKRRVLIDIYQP